MIVLDFEPGTFCFNKQSVDDAIAWLRKAKRLDEKDPKCLVHVDETGIEVIEYEDLTVEAQQAVDSYVSKL